MNQLPLDGPRMPSQVPLARTRVPLPPPIFWCCNLLQLHREQKMESSRLTPTLLGVVSRMTPAERSKRSRISAKC